MCVIVPHIYGLASDMPPIIELAKQHGFFVVEDCAQALGAESGGTKAGSWGDFGCFSFHIHKNISTLGEGGILTVKDPELAKAVLGLRHNGLCGLPEPREKYWVVAMGNVDLFFPSDFTLQFYWRSSMRPWRKTHRAGRSTGEAACGAGQAVQGRGEEKIGRAHV